MYKTKSNDGTQTTALDKGGIIIKNTTTDTPSPVNCFVGINTGTLQAAGTYTGNITFHVNLTDITP